MRRHAATLSAMEEVLKALGKFLFQIWLIALVILTCALMSFAKPAPAPTPQQSTTFGIRAMATNAHNVTLTCTLPSPLPAGGFVEFYRSGTSGGESQANPVLTNQPGCAGTDTAVQANQTAFYTAASCATSASTGAKVCSPMSVESNKVIVPLLPSDLPVPGGLAGSGN